MTPTIVTFQELVKNFEAQKMLASVRCLLGDSGLAEKLGNISTRKNVIKEIENQWRTLMECCDQADLKVSVGILTRLSGWFDGSLREEFVAENILDSIWKSLVTVEEEMSSRLYFILGFSESVMYKTPLVSWEKIVERFDIPGLTENIEEMVRCYALNRYTASMFHAMHVAEWGAIELGDSIGVADHKKGWGPTSKKLKELIDAGRTKVPPNIAERFNFLEQIYVSMNTMMLAWRHKIDHAANHLAILPNAEFAPDLSGHIIGSVKVFMTRLVEGIPK